MKDEIKNTPAPAVDEEKVPTPVVEKEDKIPAWAKALQEKVSGLEAENEMLKDMAGKNAIASYKEGKKEADTKTAYLKIWNDKMVIGWEKLDYTHFNPRAVDGLTENILTNLILEDGSKEQVNYIVFNNSTEKVDLEIESQKGDMTTLLLPTGKKLTIETRFLNR